MAGTREFRGYYCARCHSYTRLYRDGRGAFTGVCPRCGKSLFLPGAAADGGLFHTQSVDPTRLINVWDHYDGGKIIGQLIPGTAAKLLGSTRHRSVVWRRIRVGKLEGWVSGAFIRRLKRR